jgi:hypothetical protein
MGNPTMKQNTFVDLSATYTLWHESGEFLDIPALGHGIDPQDKAAGKATTYAMKNALLYLLNIAVGGIDDTDTEHSNDKEVPVKEVAKPTEKKTKPISTNENLEIALKMIRNNPGNYDTIINSEKVSWTKEHLNSIESEFNLIMAS